jgi:hypothetical protein
MPQLVKLQDELKDSGFTIVAPHAQDASQEDVVALARQLKVNFTVVSSGEVPGETIGGIPAAFLFDSSGKLVQKGHPATMKQAIHDLVQREPHFLAAGRTYTKQKAVAESLKKSKAFGPMLKKLEKDLKGEGAAAEEATYLTERITAFGKKRLDEAKASETADAFAAQQLYTELAASFKGVEIGDQAAARLKELKNDKEFQTELKAATIAQQIRVECAKLVAQGGKVDLNYSPNKKVATSVLASYTALKKKYPESKALAGLKSELGGYGFKEL